MPIILKSRREIELMRRAGKVAFDILQAMKQAAVPGVRTIDIDELARDRMEAVGARSTSRNYPTYKPGEGYPGYTCISVNEEVIHGIPGPRTLREGDIVTLDLALTYEGFCADTAITIPIGAVSPAAARLLEVTRESLDLAIANIRPDRWWSEIARLIQGNVERAGFSVVREFVGHGVGRSMHEDPKVPNFVTNEQVQSNFKIRPGMTFAVEPMVVMGRRDVEMMPDSWTVVTRDGLPAAHFEHTIAVTPDGADILTDGRPARL